MLLQCHSVNRRLTICEFLVWTYLEEGGPLGQGQVKSLWVLRMHHFPRGKSDKTNKWGKEV